ncbi:DUF4198 domain-containing protein [Crateriforma conspicua]|uniref:Nickel uptake substrate-specific transmembrane region n=1 Tax=Crateriforma conspicua TaxID=2527996 RepID=A0A5C5Y4A4_9PLAN|nr:DUF4198 domain-containing protein [Crateriforma conspicua]TWT70606.1 Nickel uptake substrate-specific transmembrane region [Crateriforma conspicua]
MHRFLLTILAAGCLIPITASAHKTWLLPSQTVFSGNDPWLTVDAAVSNDLFYFNHFPLGLEGLQITAPDGNSVEPENAAQLKYRSVFDVPLTQRGTYRIARVSNGVFAGYELNGERKRWRGKPESMATEIPKEATNLRVTESVSRIETFVSNGPLTTENLQPTGNGIELVPITHPNDLFEGEQATFRLVVNAEPSKGQEVTILRGGTRYRNAQDEIHVTTDANGEFQITWPKPGMYWIETSIQDSHTSVDQANSRRLGYTATLEVLPQ